MMYLLRKNDVTRFARNDVFRFAQNDVSLCDMMYLLRKYDVASLRAAMMKYPPFAAGKHHCRRQHHVPKAHIIRVANIIAVGNIIQFPHSFKNFIAYCFGLIPTCFLKVLEKLL